jgi:diadenosine tetraphosphate (Ap4A) HIT family hydrolase
MICDQIANWRDNENPFFIYEFRHSIFVLGMHQYFQGYSLILLKEHVRELHELDENDQRELFGELMIAGKAVFEAFEPWKMNYSCYGNTVEHIHWHIFPRYLEDPDHRNHPWLHVSEFDKYAVNQKRRSELITRIREKIEAG